MEKKIVGVIAAMEAELTALKILLPFKMDFYHSGMTFTLCEIQSCKLVICQCGVGKVAAAMCAQMMASYYHVDMIVNIGVGGALVPGMKIGDLCIGTHVVQHDLDTTALGDPPGYVSGLGTVHLACDGAMVLKFQRIAEKIGLRAASGTIATGDVFVSDAALKHEIASNFGAIMCDMESAAIAQVCYANDVMFSVLRAASDRGDENASEEYEQSMKVEAAALVPVEVLRRFLHL